MSLIFLCSDCCGPKQFTLQKFPESSTAPLPDWRVNIGTQLDWMRGTIGYAHDATAVYLVGGDGSLQDQLDVSTTQAAADDVGNIYLLRGVRVYKYSPAKVLQWSMPTNLRVSATGIWPTADGDRVFVWCGSTPYENLAWLQGSSGSLMNRDNFAGNDYTGTPVTIAVKHVDSLYRFWLNYNPNLNDTWMEMWDRDAVVEVFAYDYGFQNNGSVVGGNDAGNTFVVRDRVDRGYYFEKLEPDTYPPPPFGPVEVIVDYSNPLIGFPASGWIAAVDSKENLLVADSTRLLKFASAGNKLWETPHGMATTVNGIKIDANDDVWLSGLGPL